MSKARKTRRADLTKGPESLDISRFGPANRQRLSAPALRTFVAIADMWRLTNEQRLLMLGYPSRSLYGRWCKQAREHRTLTLNIDVLTRISAVLGIHQNLGAIFPTEQLGVEWLQTPHDATVFGGKPPVAVMTNGTQDGLLTVRRFLASAHGGLYVQPNIIDEAFFPYSEAEILLR